MCLEARLRRTSNKFRQRLGTEEQGLRRVLSQKQHWQRIMLTRYNDSSSYMVPPYFSQGDQCRQDRLGNASLSILLISLSHWGEQPGKRSSLRGTTKSAPLACGVHTKMPGAHTSYIHMYIGQARPSKADRPLILLAHGVESGPTTVVNCNVVRAIL